MQKHYQVPILSYSFEFARRAPSKKILNRKICIFDGLPVNGAHLSSESRGIDRMHAKRAPEHLLLFLNILLSQIYISWQRITAGRL